MKIKKLRCAAACSFFVLASCVSLDSQKEHAAPQVTDKTPLINALEAAQTHGGDTLKKVTERTRRLKELSQVASWSKDEIMKRSEAMEPSALIATVRLYQNSIQRLDENVFIQLVSDKRVLARQLGWQLAANLPSPQVASWIQDTLSQALIDGSETQHMIPQMANAVVSNRLSGSYTLVRRGLMETGDEAFVKAMTRLNPQLASGDFLDYLALAPVEELRQLTQKSVNVVACIGILRHLAVYPAPINHPQYEQLFKYGVSRNMTLSALANAAIESDMVQQRGQMALTLARMPAWVQVAYVENARRQRSTQVDLFLGELRRISRLDDVVSEINEVLR